MFASKKLSIRSPASNVYTYIGDKHNANVEYILLLQRRFRRESIVLMPSKKHHLVEIRGGAFFRIHTFDF